MKINQNGRSMVEMLGVLAIIGVLSVGSIAGYSKAMYKYKINKFTDQMTNIIANIRTAYSTQKTTNGLNNENIKKMGLVPDDMYKSSDPYSIRHFWGGTIYFGTASTYDSATMSRPMNVDGVFYISMNEIPKDVCIAMLTSDWGQDLVGMGAHFVGSSPMPPDNANKPGSEDFGKTGDKDYPVPFSILRAEKVCAKAEESNSSLGMTLYWYFKL